MGAVVVLRRRQGAPAGDERQQAARRRLEFQSGGRAGVPRVYEQRQRHAPLLRRRSDVTAHLHGITTPPPLHVHRTADRLAYYWPVEL